jgi:hypothetical protein
MISVALFPMFVQPIFIGYLFALAAGSLYCKQTKERGFKPISCVYF